MPLQWAADDRLVFMSYQDGWPHIYSLQHPGEGTKPLLLTPGNFMVEHASLTPDGRALVYAANAGADKDDIDRRHLFNVPVDAASPVTLTSGRSMEWTPVVTSDGATVAFLSSTAQRSPLPAIVPIAGGTPKTLAADRVPAAVPDDAARDAGSGGVSGAGRHAGARAALQDARRRRQAPRPHLRARRSAAADAARLALHGLLRQRLRDEPVPREPRLHRAVGELPARHRLRARVPLPGGRRRARRVGVSGRARRREAAPAAARRRRLARRHLGRIVRRLPHRAGAGPQLRRLRRGRRHPRRAQLGPLRHVRAGSARRRGKATASPRTT